MPIYAKKVTSSHPTFRNRETIIYCEESIAKIPIPDSVTLCDGCNKNIEEGYLLYLGKRELKSNQPYDYYCADCLKEYFPKAIVTGDV